MTENLQKILKEIIATISVIVGTMAIYHVLAIQISILSSFFKYLPYVLRPPFVLFSPGILTAIMYKDYSPKTLIKYYLSA